MRKSLFLLPFLATLSLSAQVPCLRAHFSLDGHALDSSSAQNHGTIHGSPAATTDRFGRASGALEFDGVSDYIHTNTTYDFAERSASVWFYPTDVSANRVVFIQDANSLVYGPFNVSIHPSAQLRSRAGNLNGSVIDSQLVANQWYHAVIVRRLDSCIFYVNGKQTVAVPSGTGGSSSQPNDELVIGVGRELNVKFFQGKIDDLKVFDCVLTSQQVDSMYNWSLGLGESLAQSDWLQMFPNPAQGQVELSWPAYYDIETIRVYSMNASLIRTLNTHESNVKITGLTPGVYMIQVQGPDSFETRRLIVE